MVQNGAASLKGLGHGLADGARASHDDAVGLHLRELVQIVGLAASEGVLFVVWMGAREPGRMICPREEWLWHFGDLSTLVEEAKP